MTQYLFYNPDPRGADQTNVKEMLAALPPETVAVPFGWTAEIEAARNALLAQLGVSGISALPCLLYQNKDGVWREERIADHPKTDWTWTKVEEKVAPEKPPKEGIKG